MRRAYSEGCGSDIFPFLGRLINHSAGSGAGNDLATMRSLLQPPVSLVQCQKALLFESVIITAKSILFVTCNNFCSFHFTEKGIEMAFSPLDFPTIFFCWSLKSDHLHVHLCFGRPSLSGGGKEMCGLIFWRAAISSQIKCFLRKEGI